MKILIVGGGSGWILEEISNRESCPLLIDYVESSPVMIALAAQKKVSDNKVRFVAQPVEEVTFSETYDVILTGFLFDHFKQKKANEIFEKLNANLCHDGLWLYTEFQTGKGNLFQRMLQKSILWSMYFFFKLISRVEAHTLPRMLDLFKTKNYEKRQVKTYFHHFIISILYQKKSF